jgi:hypothetical protein
MEAYFGRTLETFGTKLEKDAILAKQFQENPVEALRSEGIPVAQYYALDYNAVAQAAAAASPQAAAQPATTATAHPPSEFVCGFWGVYFSITTAEAKALTVLKIHELIQKAYAQLSPEEKEWVGPKLSGLELGMVAGIEIWKLMGQTCGGLRVQSFSSWPRYNVVWTPPVCA